MIYIKNLTPNTPDDRPHAYAVRINDDPPLAIFRHNRAMGVAECLRQAADAVEASACLPESRG